MKFIFIFISLMMLAFGIVCLLGVDDTNGVAKVKTKIDYNALSAEDKDKVDNYIIKFKNVAFIATVSGACLFIASLFL